MKLNILSKEKNELLDRNEMKFEIDVEETTPSRKEVREKIAALTNSEAELVIVDKLKQHFGLKKIQGSARVYSNKETLKKVERAFLIKRNLGIKKKTEEKEKEKEKTAEKEGVKEKKEEKKEKDIEKAEKREKEKVEERKKENNIQEKKEKQKKPSTETSEEKEQK